MRPIAIRLTDEIIELADREARVTGQTRSEVIRSLLIAGARERGLLVPSKPTPRDEMVGALT